MHEKALNWALVLNAKIKDGNCKMQWWTWWNKSYYYYNCSTQRKISATRATAKGTRVTGEGATEAARPPARSRSATNPTLSLLPRGRRITTIRQPLRGTEPNGWSGPATDTSVTEKVTCFSSSKIAEWRGPENTGEVTPHHPGVREGLFPVKLKFSSVIF